ncbi:putative fatty acid synthase subunit alpha reductase [Rosellinia necatrix]|uniref:beta-ketoacyl-[acyl-carrier-protein] synthase I n=1 Tax=Rosellinia necatrix TaxID=77044 RepID=A0A1W2TG63_ROSNE|nr:putative fatty acid synthase subunit alpha reductase [Rosellinia necatrix]
MRPEVEQELTHTLLVELLAHQFTFPVRWIETQDAILGEIGAERIVEIGPSNILTNMMKRTWQDKFDEVDLSRGVTRRILGPQGDHAEMYYLHAKADIEEAPTPASPSDNVQKAAIAEPQPPPGQVAEPRSFANPSGPNLSVDKILDIETPVASIVMAIVGTKLKKKTGEISLGNTISSLVGGRSTLTNEIIGDLHKEFGDKLPDKAEELSLGDLCETLSLHHNGKLGKQLESILSRLVSSKFPPDYAGSTIRRILTDQWGLGPMRQDAVLLLALGQQPESRLSSPEALKYLSTLATQYFQQQGLQLPSGGSSNSQGAATAVDAKMLQAMNEKNSALAKEIMGVLQHHLRGPEGEVSQITPESAGADSARLLDIWVSEHGEDYADGIMPKFDVKKQRLFDSYWNWNAQDICTMFELCRRPRTENDVLLIREMSDAIVNRACDRSVAQIRYLISKECQGENERLARCNLMQSLLETCRDSLDRDPVFIQRTVDMAPLTTVDNKGRIQYQEIPRTISTPKVTKSSRIPISTYNNRGVPVYSHEHTVAYQFDLETMRDSGLSLRGRNVLINGAGKRSIGIHILRCLLEAGARVTLTTSSYSPETTQAYQAIYARYGSRDSVLRVLPYNQGSNRDVSDLIQYLDSDPEWDLDFIIPFAAISENGRSVEDLDSKSEIAHRLMLTNLVRLLGGIAKSKRSKGITTRPATVLLPLSPNHGLMGNDGLYSESKRSLEVLMTKWYSESWREYLSFFGVIIGWTRGTGLMTENDIVSQAVEALGVRTFAADEMAANIMCLMAGSLNDECQAGPLLVDIGGGLGKVDDFKDKLSSIRRDMNEYAEIRKALEDEKLLDEASVNGKTRAPVIVEDPVPIKANIRLPLPRLPDYETEIAPLASLQGMVDLSRVVVVTGFAELGPYGSSRTRWEIEANGALSLEGCVETAWMMGLIKHHSGTNKDGTRSSGWVDSKTMQPVADHEIASQYMPAILEHTGIRVIEPEICDGGYDPENKQSLQEIQLQRDLPSFEASAEIASQLKRQHGDKTHITTDVNTGACHVQLKTGATIMVPRSAHFDRTVAGQIPTGWSPKRYGISDDIIEQVDPVTLFSLVCTVEALLCSGIVDPYELYEHIHISEVGNCIGSSMGGLSSLRKMHRERFVDKSVKGDILQETFINTTGAWINMLLTSSSGPIRTPVGACATSLESLDTGYDLIVAKKAKVCIVGGVEDFVEDVSFEFGSMKATCNTDAEFAAGRSPREMSRPTASTRSGFVESQGCGIQVITSAELALQMGLPIFGVVAHTSMAADKASRSVPAPGKGVLTNAREAPPTPGQPPPALLDLQHRRKLLGLRKRQIADWCAGSIAALDDELLLLTDLTDEEKREHRRESAADIREEAARQVAEATFGLGNQFWRDGRAAARISPIRGSLATWGLGVDDLGAASLHGTSTAQNDLNETLVLEAQLRHLGRRAGNLLPCVCQKWLTGHAKGAAGAWMLNGCLQMLDSGVVPGNRNADNVDAKLREREHLQFPGVSLHTAGAGAGGGGGIKACSVTSFGFGQKGAQAILVHPRYLYATTEEASFRDYAERRDKRWRRACRVFGESMVEENMVARCIKSETPYAPGDEMSVLLDPSARF